MMSLSQARDDVAVPGKGTIALLHLLARVLSIFSTVKLGYYAHGLVRTLGYNIRFPNHKHRTLDKSHFGWNVLCLVHTLFYLPWVRTNRVSLYSLFVRGKSKLQYQALNRKINSSPPSNVSYLFVLRKKGSKTEERMKEEETEKGDCGPPTRKVFF